MSAFIGVDVGTGGARALAVDESGEVLGEASAEYPLYSPHPGWSEQDPADWWRATQEVLGRATREAEGEIVGLGLTGQQHGSVFLDAGDGVIRRALLWNDQRTETQAREISEKVGEKRLAGVAGSYPITAVTASKILWLRDEEPENFGRVSHVLLPKDYVRLLLTGEYATDASDASGTLLLDVRSRDWSSELLDACEVPRGWMPRVYEGPESTGTLREEVAGELGLPAGIPVAGGGGRDRYRRGGPGEFLGRHQRGALRTRR